MKKIKTLYTILALLPIFLVWGCNDFFNINDNPNNPKDVPPKVLLPAGLVGSAFSNGNELNRFASTTMDYNYGTAGSPGMWDIYVTDGSNFGNQWRFEIYGGALITYDKLIEAAEKLNSKPYVGIAKIMKAYTFSIATDVWGDVPYSEALEGASALQPKLDKQEDIYKGNPTLGIQSLFDLVREGLTDLNATSASTFKPGAEDLVYGGNMDNWKRAGYTLLLKFAIQISDREPALATAVINEVISADKYITANNQNLAVRFGAAVGSQSPIYTWTYNSSFQNDMMASSGYVELLQGLNDPRLNIFITKPAGNFVTYKNGFIGTLAPVANRSKWSSAITSSDGSGPIRLLTNAQRAFILAEAALTLPGVTLPQTAQAYYTEGITASMTEAGVSTADINTYVANHPLTGTTEEQLEQIITQKYIAWTGNGLEAWNDYRRTGYPSLPEHLNAVGIDGRRPRRAQYINEEVQRNPNFTPIVFANVNVWWDVD